MPETPKRQDPVDSQQPRSADASIQELRGQYLTDERNWPVEELGSGVSREIDLSTVTPGMRFRYRYEHDKNEVRVIRLPFDEHAASVEIYSKSVDLNIGKEIGKEVGGVELTRFYDTDGRVDVSYDAQGNLEGLTYQITISSFDFEELMELLNPFGEMLTELAMAEPQTMAESEAIRHLHQNSRDELAYTSSRLVSYESGVAEGSNVSLAGEMNLKAQIVSGVKRLATDYLATFTNEEIQPFLQFHLPQGQSAKDFMDILLVSCAFTDLFAAKIIEEIITKLLKDSTSMPQGPRGRVDIGKFNSLFERLSKPENREELEEVIESAFGRASFMILCDLNEAKGEEETEIELCIEAGEHGSMFAKQEQRSGLPWEDPEEEKSTELVQGQPTPFPLEGDKVATVTVGQDTIQFTLRTLRGGERNLVFPKKLSPAQRQQIADAAFDDSIAPQTVISRLSQVGIQIA